MTPAVRSLFVISGKGLFWAALACSVLVVALEAWAQGRRAAGLTAFDSNYAYPMSAEAGSETGYVGGVRHAVAGDRFDDLVWVMHAQAAEREKTLRLRWTEFDNAPGGRAVHWSSLYLNWIRILARFDSAVTGASLPLAIERAASYGNAVLVTVTLLGLAGVAAWVFGYGAGTALALAPLGLLPFRDVFRWGVGDHHGAAIVFGVVMVTLLLAALSKAGAGVGRGMRGLSVAAGICGGLALWVNAVSVVPVLAGVFAGGLAWRLLGRHFEGAATVWRWSALGGAVTSLFGYAFEYAPDAMELRLEVNHPLYALAWLGAGELMCRLFRAGRWRDAVGRLGFWVCLAAVAPLPLLGLWRGAEVYQVVDPFLLAVHERYIMEFQSLWANLAVLPSPLRSLAMLLPHLILVLAAAWVWRRRGSGGGLWLVGLGPALAVWVLALWQARWWAEASALLLPLVCLLWVKGSLPRWARLGAGAALGLGCAFTVANAFVASPVSKRELLRVVERGVAQYLRARAGEGELTLLASPDATVNAGYYGGFRGIGTFYWENNEGLKRAAGLFAETDLDRARERLAEAGVTHVAVYSWGGFEQKYLELYKDLLDASAKAEQSLLLQLVRDRKTVPWLRPVAFPLPRDGALVGEVALLFEVVEARTEDRVLSDQFEYLIDMGWQQPALAMERALAGQVKGLSCHISLARLYAIGGRMDRFGPILAGLLRRRSDWEGLGLEDRVRLCGVLAAGRERVLAKEQLELVWTGVAREGVGRLNVGSLAHLFELEKALGDGGRDRELVAEARRFLPNSLRD